MTTWRKVDISSISTKRYFLYVLGTFFVYSSITTFLDYSYIVSNIPPEFVNDPLTSNSFIAGAIFAKYVGALVLSSIFLLSIFIYKKIQIQKNSKTEVL